MAAGAKSSTSSKRRSDQGSSRQKTARSSGTSARQKASSDNGRSRTLRTFRSGVQHAVSDHVPDFIGLLFLTLGIVTALAVWGDAAGPVGSGVDTSLRALVGRAAVFFPLVVFSAGVGLLLDRTLRYVPQMFIGAVLVLFAALGFLHLFGGPATFSAALDDISAHGGWGGAVVVIPLEASLGAWGAGVVLGAVLVAGTLLATGTTARELAKQVGVFFSADAFRRFSLPWRRLEADDPGEVGPVDANTKTIAVLADAASETTVVPDPVLIETVTGFVEDAESDFRETQDSVSARDRTQKDGARATKTGKASETARNSSAPAASALGNGQRSLGMPTATDRYRCPDLSVLRLSTGQKVSREELAERGEIIQETLREFKVGASLVKTVAGPTVTRYEIELDQGVKVNQITKLAPDICYALATPEVRIIAPIPGRSAIGLEVPNRVRQLVTVGDILMSSEATEHDHALDVALGRDISGKPVFVNLAKMPHLLIAGATGSGKSSCINSILTSLLCRSYPSEVRMILIDPKRVELGRYNRIPHLLTGVVTQPKRAAEALQWAVQEMERRYDLLHQVGVRDINSYNEGVDAGLLEPDAESSARVRLPYIVIVVDELADLMLVAPKDVENSICRIAQMARAVGIHLVIATQRPSVNVITGIIKANVPSRMAFKVRTSMDSRVILDFGGAEKLIGQGDLLYLGASSADAERIQGSFVSESEVHKVVAHWRVIGEELADDLASADEPMAGEETTEENVSLGPSGQQTALDLPDADVVFQGETAIRADEDSDELLLPAMELVVKSQLGSTSMLQRKLRVGFARAGRIMDLLEEYDIVGPSEGSKARKVLIAPEELQEYKRAIFSSAPTQEKAELGTAEAEEGHAQESELDVRNRAAHSETGATLLQ